MISHHRIGDAAHTAWIVRVYQLLLIGAGIVAAAAHASDTPSTEDTPDRMIVTASRIAEPLEEALWSTSVITRDDIERRQAHSVEEILSGLAGVSIDNTGGLGKATSLRIRGTEADHVLVLIDGQRVGSATLGALPLENLPVSQIERIELVRGPRSTLYGSDAIGGVLQVFTRGARRQGHALHAVIGSGSAGTWRTQAGLSAGGDQLWLNLDADIMQTDGINACRGSPFPPGGGCFTDEPDEDGFDSRSGSLSAGWRSAGGGHVELKSLFFDGDTEFDGSFANDAQIAEHVASVAAAWPISASWWLRGAVGRNEDRQTNLSDGSFASRFDTARLNASLQMDGSVGDALRIVAGADHSDDEITSSAAFAEDSRATSGVFSEITAQAGRASVLLGARAEDNEQFGSETTGNAGLAYRFGYGVRASATFGTAFRAPSFNELYFPGFGNADLDPESARSVEFGVDGTFSRGRWSLRAFRTDVTDLIAFNSATFAPENLAEARLAGVETLLDWREERWQVTLQGSYLDAENRQAGANFGNVLPRRARRAARLDTLRRLGGGSIGSSVRFEGERFDELANRTPLGSYTVVDLYAEYPLGAAWLLQGRLSNLFDRAYETAALFNQPGRHWSLTVRYRGDR